MTTQPNSVNSPERTVVVTDAGSGLGRYLTLALVDKGYRVFGTARTAGEVSDVEGATGGRARLAIVDVTQDATVARWTAEVTDALGDHGLDVLIGNVGMLTPGPMELLPLDTVRHEFEVNVFGALAVINGFLPALRTAKGRIVQMGSYTARFPLPYSGPSSASKAALAAFADVYRNEIRQFGVDFVLAQAGVMRTGGTVLVPPRLAAVAESMTPEQRALYGESFGTFVDRFSNTDEAGMDPVEAAQRVIELAEQIPAVTRGPVGPDAEQILEAVRTQTDAELDAMRRSLFGLDT